ncbi:hypothetical protein P3T76_003968 [Phytophthora citrophthora]|uniref:Uncharacterized protein n=1 Tax=Phytophthora citrophthora TaxID=4793 RepID=A0AAD9GTZ3_9STRA|nr:hypothetical protein P3T76_003968 [Phytophthora citrophthora]
MLRRLTSPRSPQLQKLPIENFNRQRVKDRREEAIVRQYEQQMREEQKNQQFQCRERFLYRWHHIRNFYAIVSELMTKRNENLGNKSKLPPTGMKKPNFEKEPADSLTPAPLHTLTAMAWLIDVAREFRQGFAAHHVTLPQLEIAVGKALHLSPLTVTIATCLRNVFQSFQQPESPTIDYREVLSAFFVLDRWREGEKKMMARWFHEFSFPLVENSTAIGDMKMAVRGGDLQQILLVPCGDETDEAKTLPFVTDLLALTTQRGRGYIAESMFWEYSESHPKLLETIKTLCWKRLTDDTRLTFYRDVYIHAKERFAKEEARVRFEKALDMWRTREPRLRLARWKIFVANQKLIRRGDTHFRACSAVKMARGFKRNVKRRQEMKILMQKAAKQRNVTLVCFTFQPWALFWRSMRLIHAAAWKRSENHYLLRGCMGNWVFYKRRQAEVAAADIRGRKLQQDLQSLQEKEAELALMEIEDKLSAAVAEKARASAEKGRRRSFIDATDKVHANRKEQRQKEERIQFKASREMAAELEAKQAWKAIAEQVAAEVRSTTLTWLDTAEAKAQVRKEATRIFETDAKWIHNELERDPDNAPARILPPNCRWQVFLEAPHGIVTRKLTKAFYLNTVTYEKYWCDEVVIEECEGIAREVIIQWRIDNALSHLNEKETEWTLQRRQNTAAIRIQMMFRCRQARAVCQRIIRNTFIKRIDPSSGHVVYFNFTKPQELRRRPPKLIGKEEHLLPIESSTWVYRQDLHGNDYYERIDTGESSAGPPNHYILCTRCSVHFATRRKAATGARYCVGCYASFRYTGRRMSADNGEEDSGWTKMPVQPANCTVCRNSQADFVCQDCKYDPMCTRCFNATHARLAKDKQHTIQSLVNRVAE